MKAGDDAGPWRPIETIHQGSSFRRRVVYAPAIHIEEQTRDPGDPISGSEHRPEEGQSAQWRRLGRERYRHRSAHLCPHTTTPPPFLLARRSDPDRPCFFDTPEQDWDFWCKHRDLVFQTKGIHPADPLWDRVHALAEDIWTFRFTIQKPGGNDFSREMPWSHPTAALIYGSWCAGCGPALCALCATIGVPTRMVQVVDHMLVEAWLEDRWCLIDNVTSFAEAGGAMMLRASLADVLLDPTDPDHGFIDAQRGKYWEKTEAMYSSSTGLFHEETAVTWLTPHNALALYPGWAGPAFKSHLPDRYDLLWGRPALSHPALILKRGQAFRRRFWIGSLDRTAALVATFHGAPGTDADLPQHHVPRDGGTWFVAVNGQRFPIERWDFHRDDPGQPATLKDCRWRHRFEIPLELLREHDWNRIAIGSTGSGAEFLRFGGTSDWILPEERCFLPRVPERVD